MTWDQTSLPIELKGTTDMQTSSLRSIELFAGAAGLGLGLAKAGFHHEIVVENNHAACDTIRFNQNNNHPLVQGWKVVEADVESVDFSAVAPEPDLLSGGPPCQEFSLGGKHAGAEGERNMWPWTIDAVRVLRPRAFAFENVTGLATKHREYLDYLMMALTLPDVASPHADYRDDAAFLKRCIDEGVRSVPTYRVSVATMTATDYGVAQKRSRVFLVGIRDDIAREWEAPSPTHSARELNVAKWITGEYWRRHGLSTPDMDASAVAFLRKHNREGGSDDLFATRLQPHRTVRDALIGLPNPTKGGTGQHYNHEAAPREARAYKGHTGSPIDEPSKTLRAGVHGVSGGENMIDYGPEAGDARYRHFTVREAARIQSFDDDYRFPGTWSDGLKQLGNAVPVGLGEAVGQSLVRVLS